MAQPKLVINHRNRLFAWRYEYPDILNHLKIEQRPRTQLRNILTPKPTYLPSALLQSRVTYNFYPDFNNIEYIEIYKTIYFDGLSKHRFFQYIEDIVRALSWLSLEYEKLNGSHKTNFLTGFVL